MVSDLRIGAGLLYFYGATCAGKVKRKCKRRGARNDEAAKTRVPDRVRIGLRPYQLPVFQDRRTGILALHWSRQIGKSFVLAAWAVDRLLTRPGRLVTVLSNSRDNGAEFVAKCAEVCRLNGTKYESVDKSKGARFQNMRMEVRIRAEGRIGRIKVLAANPRTARGFSGDLILDEFAFHEDSQAIWEAAEPILASSPDFLCRIASTGNGRHNLFYRMAANVGEVKMWEGLTAEQSSAECGIRSAELGTDENGKDGADEIKSKIRIKIKEEGKECIGVLIGTGIVKSPAGFAVSRITRSMAFQMGVKIYDANTREPITPEEARAQALDKRAYDQNYECAFADENLTLLSHELISAAERDGVGFICEQNWENMISRPSFPSSSSVPFFPNSAIRNPQSAIWSFLRSCTGPLYVGLDVGRKVDLSVLTVVEDLDGQKIVRAILRMQDMRLPEQQARLGEICRLPKFRRAAIDMTGLGLGLFEYAQDEFGAGRIAGINFATTVPATRAVVVEGRKRETVRVTEALAMELLQAYEDRRIWHPADGRLRDDLRKPEKRTSPGGRVSIAAVRDEAGHADHFWSLALALEAAGSAGGKFYYRAVSRPERGILV
jgi:phage FluMu gp28-like protein